MKNYKLYLSILVLVVIVFVTVGYVKKNNNSPASQTNSSAISTTTDSQGTVAGIQTDNPAPVSYKGQDGKNALELLKLAAKVDYQDSDYGAFVQSINGVANSTSKSWMFYTNGQLASVAADKYATKSTDMIEWKYQSF